MLLKLSAEQVDKATARDLQCKCRLPVHWEPAFTCDGAKVPYIIPFEAKFLTKVIDCAENMRRDLGLSEPQVSLIPFWNPGAGLK